MKWEKLSKKLDESNEQILNFDQLGEGSKKRNEPKQLAHERRASSSQEQENEPVQS